MNLLVRDLHEDTTRTLKDEAARQGLSLNALARQSLERAAQHIRRQSIFQEVEADLGEYGGVSSDDLQAVADEQRERKPAA